MIIEYKDLHPLNLKSKSLRFDEYLDQGNKWSKASCSENNFEMVLKLKGSNYLESSYVYYMVFNERGDWTLYRSKK